MSKPRSKTGSTASPSVPDFLAALEHPHKEAIEQLRAMILGLDARVTEEVKWNAPSFKLNDHFATFKLHPPTKIFLVLHTGVKPKAVVTAFVVDDPVGLLTWPAPDRCLLTLASGAELSVHQAPVRRILEQWIAQL